MENHNELTAEEVDRQINNCFPFNIHKFDFLVKYIELSKDELIVTKPRKIQITCFDVNQNFFVFGTSCGRIYAFKRHVFNAQQTFKYRLISNQINFIKLITDELLAFVTDSSIYIWNRSNQKFLYGWKCPTKAAITCLQTFLSVNDQKLLLISGDSDGCVRFHDLIKCHQNVIFTDFGFPIVQIEFIDSQTILVSSSFRTIVIENAFSEPTKQNIIKIGKNERKTCGKFGAIFSHNSNLIYGSRPSLHLIKAQTNGDVIETIRVNNIQESECPDKFEELIPKPITGKVAYKLGLLHLFCDDQYVISTNDSSLLIIQTDGQFCFRERIDKLIDVKISAANSNEAFLLLESKFIIRIQSKEFADRSQFDISSEYERSSESGGKSSDSKSSTESLLSLIKGPVITNPISFIDEELKKVFDFNKLQSKLAEKYNRFSTSIISTFDPQILPNSDRNVFISPEYENTINENIDANSSPVKEEPEILSPLVVSRKAKRKIRHQNGLIVTNGTNGMTHVNSVNSMSDVSEINNIKSMSKSSSESNILTQKSDINETYDDNRLEMILSVYREANSNNNNLNEPDEINQAYDIEDNNVFDASEPNESPEVKLTIESSMSTELESNEVRDGETKTEPELENNVDEVISWNQLNRVKSGSELEFYSFCAYGYSSKTEIGLIWFLSKDKNNLLYYPSFECLKLGKGRIVDITCATYELFVLTETGLIFKREGMDATKPVGTKWTQVKSNRSKFRITSISFNCKDGILWCCDANGETWICQTRGQKWSLNKDFSSHSIIMRKVSVSPIDCHIVWGIDKNGKVYVRSFDTSDSDKCGQQWDLVDGILVASDIVVTCDNNVLIIVPNEGIFKRNAILSVDDKINEWRPVVGPDLPQDDYIVKISGLQ